MVIKDDKVAVLEDAVSLVRANTIGTTTVYLKSATTEVATAVLRVAEPHSIRVTLRPPNLLVREEVFVIHCVVLDSEGHLFTAGDETLIRLSVDGDALVDLLKSTENGTITDAIAQSAGQFTVNAQLYSIAGRILTKKVSLYDKAECYVIIFFV